MVIKVFVKLEKIVVTCEYQQGELFYHDFMRHKINH